MRSDMLAGLRKWRLFGLLAVFLVAVTTASTTIHAYQHISSASTSTANQGDVEACGLCQLDFVTIGTSTTTVANVSEPLLTDVIGEANETSSPRVSYFSDSLRGPPADA